MAPPRREDAESSDGHPGFIKGPAVPYKGLTLRQSLISRLQAHYKYETKKITKRLLSKQAAWAESACIRFPCAQDSRFGAGDDRAAAAGKCTRRGPLLAAEADDSGRRAASATREDAGSSARHSGGGEVQWTRKDTRALYSALLVWGLPQAREQDKDDSKWETLRRASGLTKRSCGEVGAQVGGVMSEMHNLMDFRAGGESGSPQPFKSAADAMVVHVLTPVTAPRLQDRLQLIESLRGALAASEEVMQWNAPAESQGGSQFRKALTDLPPWYTPGRHDQVLARGVAAHGINWAPLFSDEGLWGSFRPAGSKPPTSQACLRRCKLVATIYERATGSEGEAALPAASPHPAPPPVPLRPDNFTPHELAELFKLLQRIGVPQTVDKHGNCGPPTWLEIHSTYLARLTAAVGAGQLQELTSSSPAGFQRLSAHLLRSMTALVNTAQSGVGPTSIGVLTPQVATILHERLQLLAKVRLAVSATAIINWSGPLADQHLAPRDGDPAWWEAGPHDAALAAGVIKHGCGEWAAILGDPDLGLPAQPPPSDSWLLGRLHHIAAYSVACRGAATASAAVVVVGAKREAPSRDSGAPGKMPRLAAAAGALGGPQGAVVVTAVPVPAPSAAVQTPGVPLVLPHPPST